MDGVRPQAGQRNYRKGGFLMIDLLTDFAAAAALIIFLEWMTPGTFK